MSCNWNGLNKNIFASTHWRASLVPAAAVTPAPIVYIRLVVVKLPVVVCLPGVIDPPAGCVLTQPGIHAGITPHTYM